MQFIIPLINKAYQIFNRCCLQKNKQHIDQLMNRSNTVITKLCLNIGTPKTINFPFVLNGKLMVIGVPIFVCIRSTLITQIIGEPCPVTITIIILLIISTGIN